MFLTGETTMPFAAVCLSAMFLGLPSSHRQNEPKPLVVIPALWDGERIPHFRRMEKPGFDPLNTPAEIAPWRKQWLLWRAARRGLA